MHSETTFHIPAIDVHGHYGDYRLHGDQAGHFTEKLCTADGPAVAKLAAAQNIAWTVVSPLTGLLPRGSKRAYEGNFEANEVVPNTPGLLQWVIVDPQDDRTYKQAEKMLRDPWCVGIKIHPEEHLYPITDFGKDFFAFANEQKALVLTHTGDPYSMPIDFIPFINESPDATLILAHLGMGYEGGVTHQIDATKESTLGNVYIDTSSMRNVIPNLIEYAVQQVGVDRLLFGTDAPLYHTGMQRARIDRADLTDDQKRAILHDQPAKLIQLDKCIKAGCKPGLDVTVESTK